VRRSGFIFDEEDAHQQYLGERRRPRVDHSGRHMNAP
jgi:hypothetical protein